MATGLARLLRRVDVDVLDVAETETAAPVVTGVAAFLAGLRRPGAVQVAMNAVDQARSAHEEARAKVIALTGQRGRQGGPDERQITAAADADAAAKGEFYARKREMKAAIEDWTPALRGALAPWRAQPAQQIVEAVNQIEQALAELAPVDRYLATWGIEPHPPLRMDDLRALRFSAERIAAEGNDR